MKKLFVANFKLYCSLTDISNWCVQSAHTGPEWAVGTTIIVCPEMIHLGFVARDLANYMFLGSQDCSVHTTGAFTGDISAAHLAEIDVFYTLIGHYERRIYHQESPELIAQKYLAAAKNGLVPIVCVAGPEDALDIFSAIKREDLTPKTVICAYEPPGSIGTGIIPDLTEIDLTCQKIRAILENSFPASELFVLYGGSVQETDAKNLSRISHIDGLLVGKASTDFQAFKKIVSFFMNRVF